MSIHLISTPIKAGLCPRCRRVVFRAHAEGVPVRADPIGLPAPQQWLAFLAGIPLLQLLHGQLHHLDPTYLPKLGRPILPHHRCDVLWEVPRETTSIQATTVQGVPF